MKASNFMGIRHVVRRYGKHAKKHPLLCVHVTYFLLLSMLGSLSLWVSPKPKQASPLSFMDALFNAVSAVTETGLGSVEMHRFSLSDQITLLLLMLVGSQVFTSAIPLFLLRFYSTNHPNISLPLYERGTQEGSTSLYQIEEAPQSIHKGSSLPIMSINDLNGGEEHPNDFNGGEEGTLHTNHFNGGEEDSFPTNEFNGGGASQYTSPPSPHLETLDVLHTKEFNASHTSPPLILSSNSSPKEDHCMHNNSKVMDDKALAVMSWVTTCYFVLSIMGGFLICLISILCSPHATTVLKRNHVNSSLFSLFSTVSAFANCGFIVLDENLEPMQRCVLMLLCLCALMLMGNTLYAPILRLVICLLYKTSKGHRKQVYGYILNGSTRSYTHLFPRKETTWLLGTVVFINAFQIICILGLDWRSQALQGLGAGYKIVAALLQSITTRSAGMNVVGISGFSTSTLFVSLGAMYITSYPIYLTKKQMKKDYNGVATKSKTSVFTQQLVKLRAQDSFLFVSIFLICIFERDSIMNDSINFSFFNILFEVISGYGNVGLSIGYKCSATSVCMEISCSISGRWSVGSKMVLIVVMLLGRHKGLLEDIDWKISPPLL